MSKTLLTGGMLLLGSMIFAQNSGNYIVVINGDSIHTDLDKDIEYETPGGESLTIRVAQPDILVYSDDMISFSYERTLSISNSVIDDGIEQCMGMKSTGNGFMVQKYKTINPSSLTRLMVNELTKENLLSILTEMEPTHTEMMEELYARVKDTFEGGVQWYGETVKLDLEARGSIERTKAKPERYRLMDNDAIEM